MEDNRLLTFSISLTGLFQAASTILICCTCLAIVNQISYPTELLSHFRLQFFGGGILFGLYFWFKRQKHWAIAMGGVCILNIPFLLPLYWGADQGDLERPKDVFKLLLCNVNTHNENYDKVIELIQHESPNIVILQEVSSPWVDAMQPIEDGLPCLLSIPQSDNFGMAIYSNIPGALAEEIQLCEANIPSIVMNCKLSGRDLTILVTHPLPPINAQYYFLRNQQLENAAKEISQFKTPTLLLGDLNTTMWSSDFQKLLSSTGLENGRKGFGILPSWPATLGIFGIPLDHCLVSPELTVRDMKIGPNVGSDHLPLIIEVTL